MLLLQAPDALDELARECVVQSGRRVTGFSGPLEQVRRARRVLGLVEAVAQLEADEELYSLELSDLVLPEALSSGRLVCRAPVPEERAMLCAWRHAYDMKCWAPALRSKLVRVRQGS